MGDLPQASFGLAHCSAPGSSAAVWRARGRQAAGRPRWRSGEWRHRAPGGGVEGRKWAPSLGPCPGVCAATQPGRGGPSPSPKSAILRAAADTEGQPTRSRGGGGEGRGKRERSGAGLPYSRLSAADLGEGANDADQPQGKRTGIPPRHTR